MKALKVVPAKHYRMRSLVAVMSGQILAPCVVTVRDENEQAEMLDCIKRQFNPAPYAPTAVGRVPTSYAPQYCVCAQNKRNGGYCQHNSLYLRK